MLECGHRCYCAGNLNVRWYLGVCIIPPPLGITRTAQPEINSMKWIGSGRKVDVERGLYRPFNPAKGIF